LDLCACIELYGHNYNAIRHSRIWDFETEKNSNGITAMKSAKAGYLVSVTVEGHEIAMQLETGATVSIIP